VAPHTTEELLGQVGVEVSDLRERARGEPAAEDKPTSGWPPEVSAPRDITGSSPDIDP
jgi:hypothetical protein